MRFTPDPSLNDQTANLAGAIGGEVKHQHMEAVGRKYMRFTPDPSLNDQTANLAGAIGGEVKHQHPYDQNPKVNGQMTRPLSPVARRSIPIFGPNELRNMRAKPR